MKRPTAVVILATELAPPEAPADGIGLMIVVVDCSGSMDDKGEEGWSDKMGIAKRCLSSLVAKAEAFAKEHPEKKILAGVSMFSTSTEMLLKMQPPSAAALAEVLPKIGVFGGTGMSAAIEAAKKTLEATNLRKNHILVITDGVGNTDHIFDYVKQAGPQIPIVLSANSATQLQGALEYILAGKILAE